MKINVVQIPDGGLSLTLHRDGDWFRERLRDGPGGDDCALDRADVSCRVTKSGETVIIEGKLEAVVKTSCSRCLEPVRFPREIEFRYVLAPKPEQAAGKFGAETGLSEEELDFGYYEGGLIDLDPFIFEQIVLLIPIKALCDESCKGLCPRCGRNLNDGSCGCPPEPPSGKFAALKNFRV